MKKAFALILALVAVAAFAQEASITGYGKAAWAFNLDTQLHGFTNSYGLTVNIPLLDDATKEATGEGVYGKASVTGLTINVYLDAVGGTASFDPSDATLSAAIVTGALTTTIYSAPSLSLNNASHFSPWRDDDADYSYVGTRFNPAVGGGLTFAYLLGDLGTFTAKIASATAGATNDDTYAFTGGIVLTPIELVTLTLGGGFDNTTKNAGATVKAAFAIAEGISSFVASDLFFPDGADMEFDGRFNVAATFGTTTVTADAYFQDTALITNKLDFGLKVADTGIVEGLSATVGVYAMDLLADPAHDPMFLGFADSLSYKAMLDDVNYVKPYQYAAYDLVDTNLYLKIGVEAKLIANTIFDLNWTAGSTTNKGFPGTGFVATGLDTTDGVITVSAKVSF